MTWFGVLGCWEAFCFIGSAIVGFLSIFRRDTRSSTALSDSFVWSMPECSWLGSPLVLIAVCCTDTTEFTIIWWALSVQSGLLLCSFRTDNGWPDDDIWIFLLVLLDFFREAHTGTHLEGDTVLPSTNDRLSMGSLFLLMRWDRSWELRSQYTQKWKRICPVIHQLISRILPHNNTNTRILHLLYVFGIFAHDSELAALF